MDVSIMDNQRRPNLRGRRGCWSAKCCDELTTFGEKTHQLVMVELALSCFLPGVSESTPGVPNLWNLMPDHLRWS